MRSSLFQRGLVQPWFTGYMLVGLVVSGIVPILIPLSMDPKGEFAVGAVVAAFYLGTLAAPFFGSVADRTGTQRLVFIASFPIIAAASATFGLVDGTAARFVCMLAAGAGAGAAQTTASMFIVEGRPAPSGVSGWAGCDWPSAAARWQASPSPRGLRTDWRRAGSWSASSWRSAPS